jgi:hypothetical protein
MRLPSHSEPSSGVLVAFEADRNDAAVTVKIAGLAAQGRASTAGFAIHRRRLSDPLLPAIMSEAI